jgi:hypothetical protein
VWIGRGGKVGFCGGRPQPRESKKTLRAIEAVGDGAVL